jgi:serine/threonine protein kinase
MLTAGQQVDRYELVAPIGEGGMAQVWVARQHGKHGFQKLFALKAIHHRFADDPAFRAMFLDEARIASAIEHPNVAQVFDLGEKDNVLYLVMEYVDGDSLSAILSALAKRRGEKTATLPPAIALRIVADALAGVDAAHRLKGAAGDLRGVVHRDISPSNILVSVRGDVKVIDFGIAHARDRASADTGAGSLKGKINYMAPEQALKEPLGPFTDVFGAGATLYRLLSGRSPYDGGSETGTLALLMSRAAPAPLGDHVSPLVSAIVARATAPDPGDRYASAREMAKAIEAAIVEERYVADLASWVQGNLSDRARARRDQLAQKKQSEPPPAPDLALAETEEMPAREEPTKTPGFMDVRALAAKAPVKPVAAPETPQREPPKVLRKEVTPAVVGYEAPPKKRRVPRWLLVVAAALGVLTLAVVIAAPAMVKSRVIEKAREVGVELEVGSAAVSLAGITLRDVNARIPRLPEITALSVKRIEVVGFSGREVRVTNLDATIDGPLDDVTKKALVLVEENRPRVAGTPSDPRRYALVSSRLTWTRAFGEGSRIDAGEIGVDVDT